MRCGQPLVVLLLALPLQKKLLHLALNALGRGYTLR